MFWVYCISSLVIGVFWEVNKGGFSISTARERLKPEVASPVDRATTVFCACFVDIYRLSLYCYNVISAFLIAENGGKTILAARGRVRPEVKSPFDSLSAFWYWRFGIDRHVKIFGYLLPVKSYSTFLICMYNALWNFLGKVHSPWKKFSSMKPPKALPSVNSRCLMHCACKLVQWSGLEDR
jgi:hypothetical protein